jgi:hypothetical protein
MGFSMKSRRIVLALVSFIFSYNFYVQAAYASPISVKVLGVSPGSSAGFADHDDQGWFWGGFISLKGIADGTPLKCTEKAETAKGKILTSKTFTGTAKDNFISPNGVINTTSTIGPQIKKVVATCTFNF